MEPKGKSGLLVLKHVMHEQQSQRTNFLFQLSISLQVLTKSMSHFPKAFFAM